MYAVSKHACLSREHAGGWGWDLARELLCSAQVEAHPRHVILLHHIELLRVQFVSSISAATQTSGAASVSDLTGSAAVLHHFSFRLDKHNSAGPAQEQHAQDQNAAQYGGNRRVWRTTEVPGRELGGRGEAGAWGEMKRE